MNPTIVAPRSGRVAGRDGAAEEVLLCRQPGFGRNRMLVDNGVNVVFHGHDHVYVKEVHRDGIIYQAVAQPSRKAE